MYIYGNNSGCSVNNECESGYSLYFPCVKTLTRGEITCFDFYIVDNATKEEVDLREVDDITLNITGRYNCNFGSYSYPENIKSTQVEKFSEFIYDIDFSNIINKVDLYIDIVDENLELIESYIFDENLLLDIAIDGYIGYFLKGSEKHGFLNLTGFDTEKYIFLGWHIYEDDDNECNSENIYNFLIKYNNLSYFINDDYIIRAVYRKRKEYTISMDKDNKNSSFIVEYMNDKIEIKNEESITALEGHNVKVSCIPNDVIPYRFVKWDDGFDEPYRVLKVEGDNSTILLKAYCELGNNIINFYDNIDVNTLNIFKTDTHLDIKDSMFIDQYFIDGICINNCEIDILNDIPYVKIIEDGYIQIQNIPKGNLKVTINNIGEDCDLFLDNYELLSSVVEENIFIFESDGGIMTVKGKDSCIFGLSIYKEDIYNKGKCMLCLNSEDTLKLHPGELVVEGGVIINENPYGISPVKFAKVTNVTPLIIKNNTI